MIGHPDHIRNALDLPPVTEPDKWAAKREPDYRPGLLPDGACAILYSENYQPFAVMGVAPWRMSQCRLPDDIRVTHIVGVQPQG